MLLKKVFYLLAENGCIPMVKFEKAEQSMSSVTLVPTGSKTIPRTARRQIERKFRNYFWKCDFEARAEIYDGPQIFEADQIQFLIVSADERKWLKSIQNIMAGNNASDHTSSKFVMSQRDFDKIPSTFTGQILVSMHDTDGKETLWIQQNKGYRIVILRGDVIVTDNVCVEVRGDATVTVTDNVNVSAYDTSKVIARGNAVINLYDSSNATVKDAVHVKLHNTSSATIYSPNADVQANDDSNVMCEYGVIYAKDNARVVQRNSSWVFLRGNSYSRAYDNGHVHIFNNATADLFDETTAIINGSGNATLHDFAKAKDLSKSPGSIIRYYLNETGQRVSVG